MTFTRMGDGLGGVLREFAQDPEFRWSMIQRAWHAAAGEAVRERATAESFDRGTLHLRVVDAQWLPALQELETDLLIAIRRRPGGDMVRRLNWVVADEAESA